MRAMRIILVVVTTFALQSCASVHSDFSALQEDVYITVGKAKISGTTPLSGDIGRTTFGKYPLKITKEGYEPIYCYLPLKPSMGAIIVDALFFAPAAFFNVQGSLPYYQVDLANHTLSYRRDVDDKWINYSISKVEEAGSRAFFGDKKVIIE